MLRYGFSRAVLCVIRVCVIFVMPTHRYPPSFRIGVLDSGHSKAAGGPGTHWVKRGENWAKGTHGNPLGLIKRYMLRVLLVLILNADLRACCDVKAFCFGVLNPHSPWLCWLLKHLLSRGCVCWGYTWIPMIWETEKESHPWFSVVCGAGIWSSHEFVYMYTHSRKSIVVCIICIHVYTYIYIYMYVHVCMYICMYVHMYVHTYM